MGYSGSLVVVLDGCRLAREISRHNLSFVSLAEPLCNPFDVGPWNFSILRDNPTFVDLNSI